MILFLVFISTWNVFPVSRGLGFFLNKKLYQDVRKVVVKDPDARWVVFNDALMAGFLMTTGANVFNGTKYTPNIPAMRLMDPTGKHDSIYNRYANIVIGTKPDLDSVNFNLIYEDFYSVAVNPASAKLKELKIKYLLMPNNQYYNVEIGKRDGVVPVYDKPVDSYWILEIKDAPAQSH